MNVKRRLIFLILLLVVLAVFGMANIAVACPTCKDSLAENSGQAVNMAKGYGYSIVFMLCAPFIIFTSIGLYFYWEVCKARARVAAGLPYHEWMQSGDPRAANHSFGDPSFGSRSAPISPGRGS